VNDFNELFAITESRIAGASGSRPERTVASLSHLRLVKWTVPHRDWRSEDHSEIEQEDEEGEDGGHHLENGLMSDLGQRYIGNMHRKGIYS